MGAYCCKGVINLSLSYSDHTSVLLIDLLCYSDYTGIIRIT